jgi:hypothetical protein
MAIATPAAMPRCFRVSARKPRPPSNCQMGRRLNRFSHAAVCAMAYQIGSPVVMAASHAATAEPNPQIGTRQAHARVFAHVARILLHSHEGAEKRNEHRRAGRDVVLAQRHHVAHFVDVDGHHEAERESPAEQRPIHREERQHAGEGAELGQPQQQQLEFRQGDQ